MYLAAVEFRPATITQLTDLTEKLDILVTESFLKRQ